MRNEYRNPHPFLIRAFRVIRGQNPGGAHPAERTPKKIGKSEVGHLYFSQVFLDRAITNLRG